MPPADDVKNGLWGAWRMMLGHADGLKAMDLTVDGFWNSFAAIVVALPPLALGWVVTARQVAYYDANPDETVSLVVRFALVDIGSWILPIVALALVARQARIGDRFVHYVVASNWASAIVLWIMLVPQLLRLVLADEQLDLLISLAVFIVTLFGLWRVTNLAIAKGAPMGVAVFSGMFAASLLVLYGLQAVLGLDIQ